MATASEVSTKLQEAQAMIAKTLQSASGGSGLEARVAQLESEARSLKSSEERRVVPPTIRGSRMEWGLAHLILGFPCIGPMYMYTQLAVQSQGRFGMGHHGLMERSEPCFHM